MPEEIRTERLTLRPLRPEDAPRIAEFCGDADVSRWLPQVPHPYPVEAAEAFVSAMRETGAPVWAIEPAGNDAREGLVGVIGLNGQATDGHLGFWLGRAYWGRGYATEAARAVLAHGVAPEDRGRIRSGVVADNRASRAVLRKLGFRETGRVHRAGASQGERVTHIALALAPDDRWPV